MGKYDKLMEYLRNEITKSEDYVGDSGNDYALGTLNGMKNLLFEIEQFAEAEYERREYTGWD